MNTVYCIRDYVYMDGTVKWKGGKYYDFLKSNETGVLCYVKTELDVGEGWSPMTRYYFDIHFLDIESSRDRKIDEILK